MGRNFWRTANEAYTFGDRVGQGMIAAKLQGDLSRAADVKPETVSSTDLTETTQGTDGMVYDEDTGQYLA